MKKIFAATLSVMVLFSCNNNKKQEDDAFNQIMKVHDSVMALDEKLTNDKAKLDTIRHNPLAIANTVAEKEKVQTLIDQLGAAEDSMDKWMHQFEPDQSNKAHDAKMKYFDEQKKQIMSVDTQINNAIKAADQFIKDHQKTV